MRLVVSPATPPNRSVLSLVFTEGPPRRRGWHRITATPVDRQVAELRYPTLSSGRTRGLRLLRSLRDRPLQLALVERGGARAQPKEILDITGWPR